MKADPGPCEAGSVFHIAQHREFQELEELGTAPPPVCLKCRGCRDCTFRRRRLSPEEQEVVSRVEKEMQVDSVSGIITAKYPWKNCVRRIGQQPTASAARARAHGEAHEGSGGHTTTM